MQKIAAAARPRRVTASRLLPALVLGAGGLLAARSFIGQTGGHLSGGSPRSAFTARNLFFAEPKGSEVPIPDAPKKDAKHFIKGAPLYEPWPAGMEQIQLGMGCFWCSENLYMRMDGIYSTQVGYAGGKIKNPSYRDVCSGMTNHNEVVRLVYDPKVVSLRSILEIFWSRHDPTTLNRQGGDCGTQYRSGIYYYTEEQKQIAEKSREIYQEQLSARGYDKISTEIVPAEKFWIAEDYHQQYDARPGSRQYCGLQPTGIAFDAAKL
eukprot:TRINITY_DN230_c0_g2_i1.p1 TRINITY_DN230_c0_g2~~TRINITY_DN230_c0_g2_i1.p1  ORF type:complete len:283 (+),score=44.21 TRINITY_DN230_c0_g2_i1:55-849(+)